MTRWKSGGAQARTQDAPQAGSRANLQASDTRAAEVQQGVGRRQQLPCGCGAPHGCYGCWAVLRPEAEGAEAGKLRRRPARARSLRRKKTQEGRWRAGLSPGTRCASETRCLRANIMSLRNRWLEDRAEELNSAAAITDPNLSVKASECSPNVAVKLRQLHALETQAVATVQKMMTILSEVLPI